MATIDEIMNYEGGIGESGTANYEPGYSGYYDYAPTSLASYNYPISSNTNTGYTTPSTNTGVTGDFSMYGSILDPVKASLSSNVATQPSVRPTIGGASSSYSRTIQGAKPMPYFEGMTDWRGNPITPGTRGYWQMPTVQPYTPGTYAAPTIDKARISELTQEKAAPATSRLGRSLNEALTRMSVEDNPYIQRQLAREALSGYGQGLGSIMTGAGREGRAEYMQEYEPQARASLLNYQAQEAANRANWQEAVNRTNSMYQAALRDYYGSQR